MMNSDALIALPGGTGTVEELMEAITWKRLELINLPIFIVNLDGFYDPLLDLFENMFKERFISRSLENAWTVVKSIDEAIDKLKLVIFRFLIYYRELFNSFMLSHTDISQLDFWILKGSSYLSACFNCALN